MSALHQRRKPHDPPATSSEEPSDSATATARESPYDTRSESSPKSGTHTEQQQQLQKTEKQGCPGFVFWLFLSLARLVSGLSVSQLIKVLQEEVMKQAEVAGGSKEPLDENDFSEEQQEDHLVAKPSTGSQDIEICPNCLGKKSSFQNWPKLVKEVSVMDNNFELTMPWPRFGGTLKDLQALIEQSPNRENGHLISIGLTTPPSSERDGRIDRTRGTISGILHLAGTEYAPADFGDLEWEILLEVEATPGCGFYELESQSYWLLKM